MTTIKDQFAQVLERFPQAQMEIEDPEDIQVNKETILHLPELQLPPGWSKDKASIRFEVPVGFPFQAPRNFYSDLDLQVRSEHGHGYHIPKTTNPAELNGQKLLRFFWKIARREYSYVHSLYWSPSSDTLMTYIRVIQSRFRQLV
jgi:hypothetical protein